MTPQLKLAPTAPASATPAKSIPSHRVLPSIFHIVLTQAELHRRRGAITEETFAAQLHRLSREELEPRGLELMVRQLACGTTRFLVKAKTTGAVCDMIDCAPL